MMFRTFGITGIRIDSCSFHAPARRFDGRGSIFILGTKGEGDKWTLMENFLLFGAFCVL